MQINAKENMTTECKNYQCNVCQATPVPPGGSVMSWVERKS